eukprot:13230735-Heterocapsa_arctica.AAC.1
MGDGGFAHGENCRARKAFGLPCSVVRAEQKLLDASNCVARFCLRGGRIRAWREWPDKENFRAPLYCCSS